MQQQGRGSVYMKQQCDIVTDSLYGVASSSPKVQVPKKDIKAETFYSLWPENTDKDNR